MLYKYSAASTWQQTGSQVCVSNIAAESDGNRRVKFGKLSFMLLLSFHSFFPRAA